MKTFRLAAIIIVASLTTGMAKAQHDPIERGLNAITKEAIRGQLEFLASDFMEGRETTTKGEYVAGDYISSVFQIYGVQPAGDMGPAKFTKDTWSITEPGGYPKMIMTPGSPTYFQTIQFVQTIKEESSLEIISREGLVERKLLLQEGKDFQIRGGEMNLDLTSPLVFIGYGYKNDSIGYDDFKGIDVKGKIVIRVNGLPGINDKLSPAYKKLNLKDRLSGRNQNLRTIQENSLKASGAAAVITLGYVRTSLPVRLPNALEPIKYIMNLKLGLPADGAQQSIPMISVGFNMFDELLKDAGIDLKEFTKNAARLKTGSKELKGRMVHLRMEKTTQALPGRNVIARIEGENPNEVIVVGAHYDHLGKSDEKIFNGSDDNASGTVGVMTIAKAFIASGVKPKRTVIFAAWTGEEYGLLGSEYFVRKYPQKDNLFLNLNFDMISRRPERDTSGYKVEMEFTESCQMLKDLVLNANDKYNLGLEFKFSPSIKPRGGSDFQSFSDRDVPVYSFDAATTSDYHGAEDHSDKANLDLMQKIIKAGFVSLFELANSDVKIGQAKY